MNGIRRCNLLAACHAAGVAIHRDPLDRLLAKLEGMGGWGSVKTGGKGAGVHRLFFPEMIEVVRLFEEFRVLHEKRYRLGAWVPPVGDHDPRVSTTRMAAEAEAFNDILHACWPPLSLRSA